jgi:hypothetical protein
MKPGTKRSVKFGSAIINPGELYCGVPFKDYVEKKYFRDKHFIKEKEQCCDSKFDDLDDCDASAWPKGWGFEVIFRYAAVEGKWL